MWLPETQIRIDLLLICRKARHLATETNSVKQLLKCSSFSTGFSKRRQELKAGLINGFTFLKVKYVSETVL